MLVIFYCEIIIHSSCAKPKSGRYLSVLELSEALTAAAEAEGLVRARAGVARTPAGGNASAATISSEPLPIEKGAAVRRPTRGWVVAAVFGAALVAIAFQQAGKAPPAGAGNSARAARSSASQVQAPALPPPPPPVMPAPPEPTPGVQRIGMTEGARAPVTVAPAAAVRGRRKPKPPAPPAEALAPKRPGSGSFIKDL